MQVGITMFLQFNPAYRLSFAPYWIALHLMKRMKNTIRKLLISPFLLLIYFYRIVISPWLGPKCRYNPTCSQYAI